ncbi:unnamed protein product [Ectocarpus sp. 8 AP-2014]
MRNDGPGTFPSGCKIVPVGGDLMAGPEDGVAVEQRGPGEEFHVSDVTSATGPITDHRSPMANRGPPLGRN